MSIILIILASFLGVVGVALVLASDGYESFRIPLMILALALSLGGWLIASWTKAEQHVRGIYPVYTVRSGDGVDVQIAVKDNGSTLNVGNILGGTIPSGSMVKELSYDGWSCGIYWVGTHPEFKFVAPQAEGNK